MQETEDLIQQAKMVLDFNWTGQYTKPGPRLYPHQWSWDSALIAIGYSRYDQERATREPTHLFDAQWKNGLLPQIVFKPPLRQVLPRHRLLARLREPRRPGARQDQRHSPAAGSRHGRP